MLGCVTMLDDAPAFGNWISQSGSVALVLNAPDGGNCVVQSGSDALLLNAPDGCNCVVQSGSVALLLAAGGYLRLEAGSFFVVSAAGLRKLLTLA